MAIPSKFNFLSWELWDILISCSGNSGICDRGQPWSTAVNHGRPWSTAVDHETMVSNKHNNLLSFHGQTVVRPWSDASWSVMMVTLRSTAVRPWSTMVNHQTMVSRKAGWLGQCISVIFYLCSSNIYMLYIIGKVC